MHVCTRVCMRYVLNLGPLPQRDGTVSVPEQNKRKQDTQTMGDKSLTFLGPALCRGVPRGPPCTCGFRVEDSAGVSQDLCSESHQYVSVSKHKAQDVPGGKNSTSFVSDCSTEESGWEKRRVTAEGVVTDVECIAVFFVFF